MSSLLIKLGLFLTLVLTFTSLVAGALGSTQPLHLALRGITENCEGQLQPCWYGILPGVTTLKQTGALINRYGYPQECIHISQQNEIVTSLELWPCASLPPLQFGDVVSRFGAVEGVADVPVYSDLIYGNDFVVFENRFVSAELSSIDWVKYRFDNVVPLMIFSEPVTKIDLRWYGNIPRWKLCQLEPQYYVCGFCSLVSDIEVYDTSGVCK